MSETDIARRVVSSPTIEVVDAVDSRPLPDATLTIVDATGSCRTLLGVPSAAADDSGRIIVPSPTDEDSVLIIRSAGHIPAVFHGRGTDLDRAALERGCRLRVSVVDAYGRPVEDGQVILSRDTICVPTALTSTGIGHPLAQRPLWCEPTDPGGHAEFDELPDGEFFLSVFHDRLIPATGVGDASRVRVTREQSITVTMEELFGAVFECPTAAAPEHVSWGVRTLDLDRSPRVLKRLGRARDHLQARFPSAHVYVHYPRRPSEDFPIELRVAASDETFWRGGWILARLSEIDDAVYMEQVLTQGVARLTIRVIGASGRTLTGIPMVVADRESNFLVDTTSGTEIQLPHGRYVIRPSLMTGWLFRGFGGLEGIELVASETTPSQVDVRLDLDLSEVEVRLSSEPEAPQVPLHVRLDDEDGRGPTIANWKPARGPIRVRVPAGRLRIRIGGSGAYEPVDQWFEVPATDERVVLEVPLTELSADSR